MNTDGLNLDETLALTEKLQKAETRALAAEMALNAINNAWETWGEDSSNWEERERDVRRAIKQFPDLTAAREVMRKAEEWETLTWAIKAKDIQLTEYDKALSESESQLATLRAERDELAALVNLQNAAIERTIQGYRNILEMRELSGKFGLDPDTQTRYGALTKEEIEDAIATLYSALCNVTALADLKAQVRREALEEAAKLALKLAAEYEIEAEDPLSNFNSCMARSHGCYKIAAELRRMAEEGK